MDEQALLAAISQMMDTKLAQMDQRMDERLAQVDQRMDDRLAQMDQRIDEKLSKQKAEILDEATHRMKVLLETQVQTQFNLLAEGQEDILRRMPSQDDMDIIDGRLDTLEAIVKKHSREIQALKKAT